MEKAKNIFLVIFEGILFGTLGGLFAFVSLYLFHYFTYEPPPGTLCILITPIYKLINFPSVIIFLTVSFWAGKIILKLLKKQNLQWFYNVIFFMLATFSLQTYLIYLYIQQMGFSDTEPIAEQIFQIGDIRLHAFVIVLASFYSLFYQIIKTRILFKPKTIC